MSEWLSARPDGVKMKLKSRTGEIKILKRRHIMNNKQVLKSDPERLLASLSPETMDKLADLVAAKLKGFLLPTLSSKQVVAGPSPFSRSKI